MGFEVLACICETSVTGRAWMGRRSDLEGFRVSERAHVPMQSTQQHKCIGPRCRGRSRGRPVVRWDDNLRKFANEYFESACYEVSLANNFLEHEEHFVRFSLGLQE